jgi:indole-3-glycerol phosphate synthase
MGLNCRDLESLQISFQRFAQLRNQMPDAWPCVAESGVTSPADAAEVAQLGYRLALVGTSLMQRPDPAVALRDLLETGRAAAR